jgi:hypothetical protein
MYGFLNPFNRRSGPANMKVFLFSFFRGKFRPVRILPNPDPLTIFNPEPIQIRIRIQNTGKKTKK